MTTKYEIIPKYILTIFKNNFFPIFNIQSNSMNYESARGILPMKAMENNGKTT